MTKTNLLVITNDTHMSDTQRATLTAHVQAVADKVGAELLVLLPGQHAQLLDVRVTPDKATTGEIKEGLRTCSASRGAHLGSQPTGFTVPRDQVELIHKRVEDIGALLYRWDSAGKPAAHVDCGVSILQKVEATTAQLRDELKTGVISNRFIPNTLQSEAIRLVAKLINAGAVALIDDQYVPGQLVFRNLKMDKEDCGLRDSCANPLPVAEPLAAVEGMAIDLSNDPLEQAIDQAVRLVAEAEGELAVKFSRHLDALLAIQLEQVSSHEHH